MTERERVIKGLELCTENESISECVKCPYIGGSTVDNCMGTLMRDALAQLKAQEPNAIPVGWMNEKFLDVLNKDRALSAAAWLVLHAWQKEQEAQE